MKTEKNEMRSRILLELDKTDKLSTQDAIRILNVSESTVRRLFSRMEAAQDIVRVYGGIRANRSPHPYQYDYLFLKEREAKTKIGRFAGDLVSNYDCIFIDCGTTTIHMIQRLQERVQQGDLHDVTVVTNSITNMELLSHCCKVTLTGGTYSPERKSLAGYLSESFLGQLHFDKSFIGVDGFSFEEGFATSNPDFARLSGVAAAKADHAMVLMDASKIGKRAFMAYDKFEKIHVIITDAAISKQDLEHFQAIGIDVLIAE